MILSFIPACRLCAACLRGQSYLCEFTAQVMTSPNFMIDGNPVSGFTGIGTFAEEMVISQHCCVKIDSDIPLDIVSLIGCGVTTGVGASINSAGILPGSSVVVFG